MSPHPEPPWGTALRPWQTGPAHRASSTPPVPPHRARRVLAALVLAVLALVGGAPAAGAALPVALDSLASAAAYPPKAPAPVPKTDRTTHPGGPHQASRRLRPVPSPAGFGTDGRNARDPRPGFGPFHVWPGPSPLDVRPGPGHPHHLRAVPARPDAQSLDARSPSADPTHQPARAGIGPAHRTSHAPPPSYDGLLTRPPDPIGPCRPAGRAPEASFAAPSGRPGALPGVRGPPGTSAGPPTGHRPRSADPASRPR